MSTRWRRRSGSTDGGSFVTFGSVSLDPLARRVTVGSDEVELTAKEFDLLECLMEHRGRVLSRVELKELVWDFSFDAQTKIGRPVRALPAEEARPGGRHHPDRSRRRLLGGPLMFRSLRARLTLSYALVFAVTLVALGFTLQLVLTQRLDRGVTNELRTAARAQASRIEEADEVLPPFDSDVPSAASLQTAVYAEPGDVYLGEPAESVPWLRHYPTDITDLTVSGERVRVVAEPAVIDGRTVAWAVAGRSLAAEDALVQRVRSLLLVGGVLRDPREPGGGLVAGGAGRPPGGARVRSSGRVRRRRLPRTADAAHVHPFGGRGARRARSRTRTGRLVRGRLPHRPDAATVAARSRRTRCRDA